MLVTFGLFSMLAAAGDPPNARLGILPCDAGEHYQFEVVDCPIELRNAGDKPIHVSQAKARFPWDSIDTGATVPPKGVAYLNAKVDLRNSEGRTTRAFRFTTDEPNHASRGSEVRAFAMSVLDQAKPTLDFGAVKLDETLPERSITLSSREVKDFRVTAIESKPEWLDATIGKDGRTITARLKANAPWGLIHHDDFVKLKINAPQQPSAWIAIEAQVVGDVISDGNPFQMGVMRTGGKHEFLVRVSSRTGKDFDIGKLDVTRIKGTAKSEACVPAAKGCQLIRVEVADDNPLGKLEGVLNVDLPKLGKVLPIELVGMLLSPETKIHDMNELINQQTQEGSQSRATSAAQSMDLTKALATSVKKEMPVLPGNGPLLKWSVAHQDVIYGYVIYRADSESGPFLRVNKQTIPVVGEGDDKSGSYQWRDDSAESGKTYWYSIGVINRNGSRQDLTGAQKVTAK